MTNTQHAPCGSWDSPIDATLVARGIPKLAEPKILGDKHFWLESQASEKGRMSLLCQHGERKFHVTPAPFNVRSKIHEYGGYAYCIAGNEIFFVNAEDQCIYRAPLQANTPDNVRAVFAQNSLRFGDLQWDERRQSIWTLAESHENPEKVENFLVRISITATGAEQQRIHAAHDFYAYPRLNSEQNLLSWIAWDHPHMPWDNTSLYVCSLSDAGTPEKLLRRDFALQESVVEPIWSPGNDLFFISDRSNWWNIYRIPQSQLFNEKEDGQAITSLHAEFATPLWSLGMSHYGFVNATTLLATCHRDGFSQLLRICCETLELESIAQPYCSISDMHCENERAIFLGSSETQTCNAVLFDGANTFSHLSQHAIPCDESYISRAQALTFPTSNNERAHAFYYPPCNPHYHVDGPAPLIAICHGGPTGQSDPSLNLKIQFWSSRGFGVVDVNYRGSSGYGRHYRQRLYNQWGLLDVQDMEAAARYLVENGCAQSQHLFVQGSSAGGYTVLAALAFGTQFAAGISLYGIGDLELLAQDTHKFEKYYLDQLVGPYPETRELYRQRSPLQHCEKISCPVLLFQGLEDKVVPPVQAKKIHDALKQKNVFVELIEYPDEGHGFRNPVNIEHAYRTQVSFLQNLLQAKTV